MVTKSLLMSHQNEAQLSVLLIHFVLSMSCIWGCEEMHFHKINYGQKTSMSQIPTTTGCLNGLFHCGLLCRNNPGCRALMRMNNTTIEAECNQEPGLLQPFTVYILQKEVTVSGKDIKNKWQNVLIEYSVLYITNHFLHTVEYLHSIS